MAEYALFLEFGKGKGKVHQHLGIRHLDMECEGRSRSRRRVITAQEAAEYLNKDPRMLCKICFPSSRATSEIQIEQSLLRQRRVA